MAARGKKASARARGATESQTTRSGKKASGRAASYDHPEAESLLRPDVGTQAQFRKKKGPQRYRYDSSLSPALEWDGQNATRELGEWLLARIEEAAALPPPQEFSEPRAFRGGPAPVEVRGLKDAVEQLRRLSRPFLDWAGKAERLSFDVPTLPLFVHERLSTKAILETLKGHQRDKQQTMWELFADPQHPVRDQVLKAYEYPDRWVNRLVLGDSLVVMNSLLHYEGLGGQVQMIYMDPPYGVRFGSNFQPFVRKRDVRHNDDDDMTREPEMVKAYRDTWELGLHSYLTYLRDRLLLARDLLSPSGSIFVQISDENLHHLLELADEVFGSDSRIGIINFVKTSGLAAASGLATACDYLVWYARDRERLKYRQLFEARDPRTAGGEMYAWVEESDGTRRRLNADERNHVEDIEGRVYRLDNLTKPGPGSRFDFEFGENTFTPGRRWWGTTPEGMGRLAKEGRLQVSGNTLSFIRFWDDFPWKPRSNLWTDTASGGFTAAKLYVVQTVTKVLDRCILMTTDPGDLILDPTCGSGTTPYVAEQWGRRWIAIDTSRVPLALARQRVLSATFPFYQLKEPDRGPVGGFVYQRRQNRRGEEVGGIVPHVTLKSIANDEPPDEEVLVDRPEVERKVTRVSGPFCVEATIPTPVDWEGDGEEDSGVAAEEYASFQERMLEVLRRSPVLHLGGGRTVRLWNVRRPAKTLSLSAEAVVLKPGAAQPDGDLTRDGDGQSGDGYPGPPGEGVVAEPARARIRREDGEPVALVFGPENGAVSEKLVYEAAREAHAKSYAHLYVVGFAIEPEARGFVEQCEAVAGVPATYVQATPDLTMGDLLKNMRSSQIFSVCGLPEIEIHRLAPEQKGGPKRFQVELLGLDVFDPSSMEADHRAGDDVPAWLLDTDYNGLCFHVGQAFFPRTAAWDDLKRSLKGEFEDSVWEHLAGSRSAPFEAGEHRRIAVKVIDDRGNELMVVESLEDGA